jgi:hypothetical protein
MFGPQYPKPITPKFIFQPPFLLIDTNPGDALPGDLTLLANEMQSRGIAARG